MGSENFEVVFRYSHVHGAWSVLSRDLGGFLLTLSVMDGETNIRLPILLGEEYLPRFLKFLSALPPGKIQTLGMFSQCVSGAASMCTKYPR